MKLRIALIIIAILLGIVAVVGVIGYINSIKASLEEEVERVGVLVAAQNIPRETKVEDIISAKMVVIKEIPRKYLANGVLTSLDEYKGYVVAAPINEGEQITATKFVRPEEIGLSFVVPEGMVAVSIPVDEVIGVSNLINVGDRVNVIATFWPEEGTSQTTKGTVEQMLPEAQASSETENTRVVTENQGVSARIEKEITRTLLWNVEVLYVGTKVASSQETKEATGLIGGRTTTETKAREIKTVTLAVSPEDSEKLVFSEEMGSVWLALVPVHGIKKEETPGRTLDNIFEE